MAGSAALAVGDDAGEGLRCRSSERCPGKKTCENESLQ
jgi:hypothetical protein